jgi:glucose/arabinose dehydrogenase
VSRIVIAIAGLLALAVSATASQPEKPKPLVTGLQHPSAATVGTDGRLYVAVEGEISKDGDGGIVVIENGQAKPFASGLDDPVRLVSFKDWLFVLDKGRVWRIDRQGKASVFVAAEAFPTKSRARDRNDISVDQNGNLFVSDHGDLKANAPGAIFQINPKGQVTTLIDGERTPGLRHPAGLVIDGNAHLLVSTDPSDLYRLRLTDRTATKIGSGFGSPLCYDKFGRLFASNFSAWRVLAIPRPGVDPVELPTDLYPGYKSIDHFQCLDPTGKFLVLVNRAAGTVSTIPAVIPGWEVDDTPLPLETEVAFPNLQWTGWKPENERGQPTPLRPLVLTHAGDGSNRVFLATQHGVIHVFPNDPKADRTQVFLDIQSKVKYDDKSNEEGFLGLAFHPDYKKNGEFYVFYTLKQPPQTNVLCRYRVSKDDPNRADPASEEELLRVNHPFWNHDGGTVVFGPDGYLYLALGDGGAANDPFGNGQNLGTLLGKVLRIDVSRSEDGKKYAIPKDNPFVGREGARPEIWCYGLRNVWRMAFDRQTGVLWTSDVGQDLYEEIDLLVRGGNYGWNLREGLHPFGAKGVGPRPDLIEPIWEYHHDVGKSLTGGCVYRGSRLPELNGAYLYADYVSGMIWALRYDPEKKRVVANRPIRDRKLPIMSFGEDEQGDVYLLTYAANGQGLYRFARTQPAAGR